MCFGGPSPSAPPAPPPPPQLPQTPTPAAVRSQVAVQNAGNGATILSGGLNPGSAQPDKLGKTSLLGQ